MSISNIITKFSGIGDLRECTDITFHNTTLPQNEWFISTSDLNPSEDTTISVIDSNITMGHDFMNSDTITT